MSDWDLLYYVCFIGVVVGAYIHGHKLGIKQGAATMYEHIYSQGTRKNDVVIVELEYESRAKTKEF